MLERDIHLLRTACRETGLKLCFGTCISMTTQGMKKKDEPGYDRLFKISPLLKHLQGKFRQIPAEEYNATDEQVIPFKGHHSLKQYLRNKPHKWGYKVFTRAGTSGIVYDFEVYQGKDTIVGDNSEGLTISGSIVTHLAKDLYGSGAKIFFDNWFSSIELLKALQSHDLHAVGTVRSSRIGKCPLKSDKELKKSGRGSYDYAVERNSNICAVRWLDSKDVTLVSSYVAVGETDSVKRFDASSKTVITVQRPEIVREYNKFMGGVDLCDMLLELYRINMPLKRWYFRFVFYCIDVSVANSWLIYRYIHFLFTSL